VQSEGHAQILSWSHSSASASSIFDAISQVTTGSPVLASSPEAQRQRGWQRRGSGAQNQKSHQAVRAKNTVC